MDHLTIVAPFRVLCGHICTFKTVPTRIIKTIHNGGDAELARITPGIGNGGFLYSLGSYLVINKSIIKAKPVPHWGVPVAFPVANKRSTVPEPFSFNGKEKNRRINGPLTDIVR